MPPATVAGQLPAHSLFLKIDGEPEDLLKFNVRRGIALNVTQLKEIMTARGISAPARGTGKNGRLLHPDRAAALVAALFPQEETSTAEFQRMVSAILNRRKVKNPELLLALVAGLDANEATHFNKMKKDATNELQRRQESKQRFAKARAKASHEDQAPTAEAPAHAAPAAAAAAAPPGQRGEDEQQAPRGPVEAHSKIRAPDEIKALLPPGVDQCYIFLQFKQRYCRAEFKRFCDAISYSSSYADNVGMIWG